MFGLMWVIDDSGKDSLVSLPREQSDQELDEFFQKINSAAGVEDD